MKNENIGNRTLDELAEEMLYSVLDGGYKAGKKLLAAVTERINDCVANPQDYLTHDLSTTGNSCLDSPARRAMKGFFHIGCVYNLNEADFVRLAKNKDAVLALVRKEMGINAREERRLATT